MLITEPTSNTSRTAALEAAAQSWVAWLQAAELLDFDRLLGAPSWPSELQGPLIPCGPRLDEAHSNVAGDHPLKHTRLSLGLVSLISFMKRKRTLSHTSLKRPDYCPSVPRPALPPVQHATARPPATAHREPATNSLSIWQMANPREKVASLLVGCRIWLRPHKDLGKMQISHGLISLATTMHIVISFPQEDIIVTKPSKPWLSSSPTLTGRACRYPGLHRRQSLAAPSCH